MSKQAIALIVLTLTACGGGADVEDKAFYKGETHAHSNGSPDATGSPERVAGRYASLGFDFLIITDHNVHTPPPDSRIQTIAGREITADVHYTEIEGVQTILNHPFWRGGMDNADVLADSARLFEVWNTAAQLEDGFSHTLAESAWDFCLANGKIVYGVASSDRHKPEHAGTAFVMVRGGGDIVERLNAGDFYASTGVYLSEYSPGGQYVMTVDYEATGAESCDFGLITAGEFSRGKVTCITQDGATLYAWGQPTKSIVGAADA